MSESKNPDALLRSSSDRVHAFMRQGSADSSNRVISIDGQYYSGACLAGDKRPIRGDIPTYIIVAHGAFFDDSNNYHPAWLASGGATQGHFIEAPEETFKSVAFGVMIPENTILQGSSSEIGEARMQAAATQHYKGIIDGTFKIFQRYAWKKFGSVNATFPNLVFGEGGEEEGNKKEFVASIVKVEKEKSPMFYKLKESVTNGNLTKLHEDGRAYRGHSLDWLQSDMFVFGRNNAPQDLLLSKMKNTVTLRSILSILRKDALKHRKDGEFNVVFATCLQYLPENIKPYWLGKEKGLRILPFKKNFAKNLRTPTLDLLLGKDDGNKEVEPVKQEDDKVVYIYNSTTGETNIAPKSSSRGGKKSRKRRKTKKLKSKRKKRKKRRTKKRKSKKRKKRKTRRRKAGKFIPQSK